MSEHGRAGIVGEADVVETDLALDRGQVDRVGHPGLDQEPGVQAVLVRVHKPHAPLPGIVRDVSFELYRERG